MNYSESVQDIFQAYDSGALSQEDAIKAIAGLDPWVKVSERLPEKDGKYLCQIEYVNSRRTYYGVVKYDKNLRTGWYCNNSIQHVTRYQDITDPREG